MSSRQSDFQNVPSEFSKSNEDEEENEEEYEEQKGESMIEIESDENNSSCNVSDNEF